ncbi:unnamed protein product [Orchesella dallaii]|uniref:Uncharacterized protein n=1 Tax=Orchesella dallaii TaxID=48710 RepID=A0ABP1RGT7_9HEXA
MLIIAWSLVVGTWFLFLCYSWKWMSKNANAAGNENEKMRMCNLIFIGSLSVLVYVYARVTESYREVDRMEVELKQRPWRKVECPTWYIYMFYFLQLVLLEVLETGIFAVVLIGSCKLLQFLFSMELLTFLVACAMATCFGYGLAILEVRWFFCDEYFGKIEPFFTAIHWDARQNVIVFSILPSLSRWYFYPQLDDKNMPPTNFSIYIGCLATTLLVFVKCQTLFSFLMREYEEAPRFEMRIHPAQGGLDGEESHLEAVRRRRTDSFLAGLQLLLHSILLPHFASSYQRTDYISISTGTCTTLVQRMNSTTSPSGGALLPPAFTFSVGGNKYARLSSPHKNRKDFCFA